MILNEALDHKNVLDSIPVLIYANISLYSTFLCQYIQSWHGLTVQFTAFFIIWKKKKKSRKSWIFNPGDTVDIQETKEGDIRS